MSEYFYKVKLCYIILSLLLQFYHYKNCSVYTEQFFVICSTLRCYFGLRYRYWFFFLGECRCHWLAARVFLDIEVEDIVFH